MQPVRRIGTGIFLLIAHFSFAQSNQSVRGKIVDDKTNEPIVFATVRAVRGQSILGGVEKDQKGTNSFMSKETRLLQNKIDSENNEASTAWMNTPLIKALGSH